MLPQGHVTGGKDVLLKSWILNEEVSLINIQNRLTEADTLQLVAPFNPPEKLMGERGGAKP